tara:strand:+ start:116 stop:232 length:117 start_codon:yes stop_codon:yes gene_type:complete
MVKKGRKSSLKPMGAMRDTNPSTVCEHNEGVGAKTMIG